MKFFEVFKSSLYSPSFYKELGNKPLSFSIKYFYLFILIFSVVLAAAFSSYAVPAVKNFFGKTLPALSDYYPDELVINFQNGEVSTNVEEPYFLPMPDVLRENLKKDKYFSSLDNFLAIDTTSGSYIDNFGRYSALFLLTKKFLIFKNNKGVIEAQDLKSAPNVSISKESVLEGIQNFEPIGKWAAPLVVFLSFIGLFIYLNANIIYFFIATFLIWLVLKIKKINWGYKKCYQVAIHAATLPIILSVFATIFFIPKIPFLFTVILLIVVWLNFKKETALLNVEESK